MIKVVRAYDVISGQHVFSIVADDKGFKYVMQSDYKIFDADKRVQMLMEKAKDKENLSAIDYIGLATLGLSNFRYGSAREEQSSKIAVKEEQVSMMKSSLQREQQTCRSRSVDTQLRSRSAYQAYAKELRSRYRNLRSTQK